MSVFHLRLKKLRSDKKISQQELSDRLGLNRATYARYETGATQADYATLEKLADFFETSVDYLLGRTDDPTPTPKEEIPSNVNIAYLGGVKYEIDNPELLKRIKDDIELFERLKKANTPDNKKRPSLKDND